MRFINAPPNPLNPIPALLRSARQQIVNRAVLPMRYVVESCQGRAVCVRGFAPHFRFLRKDRCVRQNISHPSGPAAFLVCPSAAQAGGRRY